MMGRWDGVGSSGKRSVENILSENDEVMQFEPLKGRIMKEYVVLPDRLYNDPEKFQELLNLSYNYVSNLPSKKKNMNAIVIMAKAPVPNEVKTRLIPAILPEEASSLYHCFLIDKITQVKSIREAQHFLAYTPATSEAFFRSIIHPGFSLINQVGANLGERLANVSKNLFDQGAEKVVILDSDSPNLPTDYIREGLSRLDEVDVALGPCEDGGYYLIGMRSYVPELFSGIPWSTYEVTELTMKKAKALGLTVSLLPEWYDVDTLIDLERLKKDMDSEVNNCYFCENTCRSIRTDKYQQTCMNP